MTKSNRAKKIKKKLLTINLTWENYTKLKNISEKTLKSMTIIVRELLSSFILENKSK